MLSMLKQEIDNNLEKLFDEYSKNRSYSAELWNSMKYTPLLGGKRLRAIFALEIGRIFNAKKDELMPFAMALEIMHAYSLIHDDLPCMDNDDLRRGKPSNHKVFGQATALLAGDALIAFGAEVIIEKSPKTMDKALVLELVNDYLRTAGARGIIAGQIADIKAENSKTSDVNLLKYIHKYKTSALFELAIIGALKIAGVNDEIIKNFTKYAQNFGLLFQIYDDIIDYTLTTEELGKTAGKDKEKNKLTYVNLLGLNEAKNIFYSLQKENCDILCKMKIKSELLDKINSALVEKVEK